MTADAEFLLSKAKYRAVTGREQRRDADVLCYQIRQAFKPGEITPEEANRIGYETAITIFTTILLRWIVPGSSGISSARPALCGGSRIGCVWKMTCP